MFKKVGLGHTCLVGSKDRKTLHSRTIKALSLNDAEVETIIPAKAPLSVAKVSGSRHLVYLAGQEPWLVSLHSGLIFPTIYALWNIPQLLPAMYIHHPVLDFIVRGAHLMVPGVTNWSTDFKAGTLATVLVHGNPYPVAVGICENPLDAQGNLRTTGRALEILHYFGDGLCKLSPKPFPTYEESHDQATVRQTSCHDASSIREGALVAETQLEGDLDTTQEPAMLVECLGVDDARPDEDTASVVKNLDDLSIQPSDEDNKEARTEAVTFPIPLVDFVLRICFLQTLHGIADDQLPMEISALYSQMTADGTKLVGTAAFKRLVKEADMWEDNISPDNATQLISYKKSSFKKLIKMFQTWSKEGLISIKETRGIASVVNINRSCDKYAAFKPITIIKGNEKENKKTDKIRIRRLLAFSAAQRKALAQLGVHVDTKPMAVDEFRQTVIQHMSNDGDVILEHINGATQYHQILRGEEASAVCKGAALPVTITVEPRGNRKHITVIKGAFNYLFNVDENSVAETLRKRFASAVSVNNGIISIQGRVPIKTELTDQFGIPQQYIKML